MAKLSDEQQTEMESLESIFPDSFRHGETQINCYTMDIQPHPDSSEPNYVSIRLHVEYPANYPQNQIPIFNIESLKGLTRKQTIVLEEMANTTANNNSGNTCMFNIITELQEWLVQHNIPQDTSLHDQMKAQKELKARLQRLTFGSEEKDDEHTAADVHCMTEFDKSFRRKLGTPVTNETFVEWNKKYLEKYRQYQHELKIKLLANLDLQAPSGKQLFEQMAKNQLNIDFEIEDDLKNDIIINNNVDDHISSDENIDPLHNDNHIENDNTDNNDNENNIDDNKNNNNNNNNNNDNNNNNEIEPQNDTQQKKSKNKNKNKNKNKTDNNTTLSVGDKNAQIDKTKTVIINDESLFLDDDMPDV